jgi:uncharacterized protein YlxW (UPF0749 family)
MSDREEAVFLNAVRSLEKTVERLATTVEKHGEQLAAMEARHQQATHNQLLIATIASGLFCGIGVFILDHLHLFH